MRIRHGMRVATAIKALAEIVQESQGPYSAGFESPDLKLNFYLNWVDDAQRKLRTIFADSELEDSLLGRGYWHICGVVANYQTLGRLINEEIVAQVGYAATS